ncbi:hypothetical protein ACP275_14G270000 [Erythranthe tilingii]
MPTLFAESFITWVIYHVALQVYKAKIHNLPESFIQYLLDDSCPFLLPLSITNDDALPNRLHKPRRGRRFRSEIKASIGTLGGAVFPKLNWSAPKDAAWISSIGNLKCKKFYDIPFLLLSNFFLALRKWYPSFQPEMEFRCFVMNKLLVGFCQREVTNFYPSLVERKSNLKAMILDFFVEEVKGKFGSESLMFDVYVTKDERVKVLDFNPWGASTLALMFSWDELEDESREEGDEFELEFRIVESRCGIRPGLKTAVPYDYLDTSPGSGWDEFFKNADLKFLI